jgi:opacity protein-like surface antigen
MKKILIVATIFSILSFNQAHANSGNFEGPAVALGLGVVGYNSEINYHSSGGGSENPNYNHQLGEVNAVGIINLSYLKAMSEKWLIGGGISYDLNSARTGTSENIVDGSGNFSATTKAKHHYSIYVQPTYAFTDTTALFAKLGYHSARITINDNEGMLISNFNQTSKDVNGVGYGFGIMTFLNKNVFVKTELEFVNYQRTHVNYPARSGNLTYKLTSAAGIVSVGYRF